MLMHCYNLLDNFDWNIREPASQKHPVESRVDRKTRKASQRIQNQSLEFQSTSNDSDKENINLIYKQLKFLEGMGRDKRKKSQTTEVTIIQAITKMKLSMTIKTVPQTRRHSKN